MVGDLGYFLDSEFLAIVWQTIIADDFKVLKHDQVLIDSYPQYRYAYLVARILSKALSSSGRMKLYLEGQVEKRIHFWFEKGLLKKGGRFLEDLINPILRFFVTLGPAHLDSPTSAIFRKQWQNPGFVPSPPEVELLERYGALDLFQKKKDFMESRPRWTRVRRQVRPAILAKIAALLLSVNHSTQQLLKPDGIISAKTYVSNEIYSPTDSQVQLLVETTPYPHMAIRIGDIVYTYSQNHLLVASSTEYMYSRELSKLSDNEPDVSGSTYLKENTIGRLPRSVQVITLHLGKAKRREVKRYLELQSGKRYTNYTCAHDCSTMALKALGMENQLFDQSPSMVAMLFSMRMTLNDPWLKTFS